MGFSKLTGIIVLILRAMNLNQAVKTDQEKLDTELSANSAVSISVSFPSLSDALGLTILNGRKTDVVLEFTNDDTEPITVSSIRGELSSLKTLPVNIIPTANIVQNLTTTRYNVAVQAGEKRSLPFSFTTDLHPQDLRMNIAATILQQEGADYQIQAYNETVTITDPASSIFDPQILFLYMIMLSIAGGSLFWAFKSWVQPILPLIKRGTRGSDHTKRQTNSGKVSASLDDHSSTVSNSNKSTIKSEVSGQKEYDESWIPDHHIKKVTTKRAKGSNAKKSS